MEKLCTSASSWAHTSPGNGFITENAIAISIPVTFNPINFSELRRQKGRKKTNMICKSHEFGGRLDQCTGKVIKLEPV